MKANLLGIYEKAFTSQFSLEEKAAIAREIGFDFIELSIDESVDRQERLDYSKEQIIQMKKIILANELSIQSLCLSAHRANPFGSVDKDIRKRAYEIIEKALAFAQIIGIRNIQLAGYDVYYEKSSAKTEALFIEGLSYCVKLAEHYQIMLSIEIMDTSFIGTLANGKKYLDIINSPWLKLYVDVGNLYRHSFDIFKEIEIFKNEIVQVHIKDTKPKQYRDLNLGEGDVPLKKIKKLLINQGYCGPFVIEIWNTKGREECIQNIQRNYDYFCKL